MTDPAPWWYYCAMCAGVVAWCLVAYFWTERTKKELSDD